MLANTLAAFSKIDPSRVGLDDLARFTSIVRDSATFDTRAAARKARRYARRGTGYIAAHPRQAGISLGGVALLGLAGYAAYRMATKDKVEAVEADADASA